MNKAYVGIAKNKDGSNEYYIKEKIQIIEVKSKTKKKTHEKSKFRPKTKKPYDTSFLQ